MTIRGRVRVCVSVFARPRWVLAAVVAATCAAPTWAAQPGELIERTLAIVNGQVVTLSDVQLVRALGLIDSPREADVVAGDASRLVDRLLVLREVQRYAPPEPPEAELAARFASVRARFDSVEAWTRVLESAGFNEERLRAWIRDDLRIAAYLSQRFAAVVAPGDDEVGAYYAKQRAEFEKKGLSYESAAPTIRERLAAERRNDLIADWIADLRRRTPVVELWRDRK
jgi:hypothetical protein